MTYGVVEVFRTIQGEGFYAGTPAVFVRLAGCNLWNGQNADRESDVVKKKALCPRWCDTDFGKRFTASPEELGELVFETAGGKGGIRFVVITGGEPLLQLESTLVESLRVQGFYIAVETNGSLLPKQGVNVDWVTCSPKQPPDRLRLLRCDELKVIYPAYDPALYWDAVIADHWYIQPEADTFNVGCSAVSPSNAKRAIEYVMANPLWRLSVQLHKMLEMP